MPCKKKEQSTCTSTPRRVLHSLSTKDIAQARADYFQNSLSSRKGSLSSQKGSLSSRKGSLSSQKGPVSSRKGSLNSQKCSLSSRKGSLSSQQGSLSSRKGSVSPSVSGQYVSDQDGCNLGVYRSSYHQWPGSSGSRSQSRKQSKTCIPLCAEVSAVYDEIQQCRDAIGALTQEAQSIIRAASGLLNNCTCNKSDETVNSNSCCRKTSGKKGKTKDTFSVASGTNACVCAGEAETKKRNRENKRNTVESKQSCQKICGKKSSHKDIATASDCGCDEKKQNKKISTVHSKSDTCPACIAAKDLLKKAGSDCTCKKKTSDKNTSYVPPIVVDDCTCEKEMKKRKKKLKKTDSKNICQKIFGKKSSNKGTCCVPPLVADECACGAEMCKKCCQKKSNNKNTSFTPPLSADGCACDADKKKQNKKTDRKESCDKSTCCVPPLVADDCACGAEMCKKCCQKKSNNKNTFFTPPLSADGCACDADKENQNKKTDGKESCDKSTCCVPSLVADDCACGAEMCKKCCQKKKKDKDLCSLCIASKDRDNCVCKKDMSKKYNKAIPADSKNSCQKEFGQKTSNKDTCCFKPVVFDDWACEEAENNKHSSQKTKWSSIAMACGTPHGAENTCKCHLPPAYSQYFNCTGQISGSCQCDKNN